MNMRQLTVALALASACIFVASCRRGDQKTAHHHDDIVTPARSRRASSTGYC